jgi:uncharacterized phosphosugar-binding protein
MDFGFISEIIPIIKKMERESAESIRTAVELCSNTLSKGRVVNLFGAGHSALPCMEAFPRIGSFVGFHQITEPVLSINSFVNGKGGQRQMSFIEQTSKFASVIFQNYNFTSDDSLIVFSHSGINALPVEMVIEANRIGMSTIAVLSVQHALSQQSKVPSGEKLNEVAECVIDTCVPAHDAIVKIPENSNSGGASTIISMIIMNTIVSETAKKLVSIGCKPLIYPSHNVSDNIDDILKQEDRVFDKYKELVSML